ncbi:hypothetical protein HK101_008431, partial [Irineochytrium annulatum]
MPSVKKRVSIVQTVNANAAHTTECAVDTAMPLQDVVKDISILMNVKGHWSSFALRFNETDELVTDQTLKRKVRDGDVLKFGFSPAHLAASNVHDLDSEDELVLKRATFTLLKMIKEEEFCDEWMSRDGLEKLQNVIVGSQGNTLAYALTSLHNLMEHNSGWDKFDALFISTVSPLVHVSSGYSHLMCSSHQLVSIIVKQNLVNICRPATAIIIKLVLADATTETSSIQCYGFDVVNAAVASQSSFIPTLVHRLSATDYLLQLNSMNLINVLFRKATDRYRSEFVYLLDALDIRKVVVRLMQKSPPEELEKQLVEFQRLLIQEGHRRKRMVVDARNPTLAGLLEEVWVASGLEVEGGVKWRRIGFETEVPRKELNRVGVLGLEMIHSFVYAHKDFYLTTLADQQHRPVERRCPFARACVEVIEIMSDFWEVSTGYTTTTSFLPLLLDFEEVLFITLRLYLRMWIEMDAQNNGEDVNRVAAVVRSQFRHVIGTISPIDPSGLAIFERDISSAMFGAVRERQLKELEGDDIIMSRTPVRSLRERLYKDSYEFVKQQRIDCLVAGAWFPVIREKGRVKNLFRYYRLGPNKKFLHFGEFTEASEFRPPLDSLPQRVDMALVTDLLTGASSPIFQSKRNASENPIQFGEWTDGFNMLLDKNIANRETADFIHQLADVGVKLALLDLTGEGADVPAAPPEIPELPTNWAFYYDEEGGGLREGLGG